MLRVLCYNIWVGGTGRVDALASMMRYKHPDVIGLVEATDRQVVDELASRLDLDDYRISGDPKNEEDWQVAVISRYRINEMRVHKDAPLTKPCMEVSICMPDGKCITIFVAHLIASFSNRSAGDDIRKKEVRELIHIMKHSIGTPHLLMGDFSAVAPGERMKASNLLRYVADLQHEYKQHPESFLEPPSLDYMIPDPYNKPLGLLLKLANLLLPVLPPRNALYYLFDLGVTLFRAPHGDLQLLYKEGYVDCFRQKNPHLDGLTAPTAALSARLDYIFASPEMGQRLNSCSIIESADGIEGLYASDHLPVFAEFQ